MRVQLKCKHVYESREWPDDVETCLQCVMPFQRLHAVECREWHVGCMDCSYGRWFGADEFTANRRAAAHKHSKTTVDFLVHPSNRDQLIRRYGSTRHVKPFILGVEAERVIQNLVAQDELPDEPPF
jgi:hypothetical protein